MRVRVGVTSSILGSSEGFIGSAAILMTERVLKGRGLKMHVTCGGGERGGGSGGGGGGGGDGRGGEEAEEAVGPAAHVRALDRGEGARLDEHRVDALDEGPAAGGDLGHLVRGRVRVSGQGQGQS